MPNGSEEAAAKQANGSEEEAEAAQARGGDETKTEEEGKDPISTLL